MPYLCRGQANPSGSPILALYAVDATGHLYDPETVEFRVMDLSTGTAVQVFPASGWEDVTEDGYLDTGVFYAYDTTDEVGWTPESDEEIGKHRIDWRFTDADDTDVTRTWSFYFDVYYAGAEIPYWTYLTLNDIRNEGIDTATLSDARAVELIVRAQQYIELATHQPFRPVRDTLQFDGAGGPTLHLGIPIIGIDWMKTDHSTDALDDEMYAVYWSPSLRSDPGWGATDNRRNPKIKLGWSGSVTSTFVTSGLFGPNVARFQSSTRAHQIKGVFGYVEADGSTPALIRDAMLHIVAATGTLTSIGAASSSSGTVIRERTDMHEVEYGEASGFAALMNPLATSPEVQEILRKMRNPLGIASPATTWMTLRSG